jgi:hypothetical protein
MFPNGRGGCISSCHEAANWLVGACYGVVSAPTWRQIKLNSPASLPHLSQTSTTIVAKLSILSHFASIITYSRGYIIEV